MSKTHIVPFCMIYLISLSLQELFCVVCGGVFIGNFHFHAHMFKYVFLNHIVHCSLFLHVVYFFISFSWKSFVYTVCRFKMTLSLGFDHFISGFDGWMVNMGVHLISRDALSLSLFRKINMITALQLELAWESKDKYPAVDVAVESRVSIFKLSDVEWNELWFSRAIMIAARRHIGIAICISLINFIIFELNYFLYSLDTVARSSV